MLKGFWKILPWTTQKWGWGCLVWDKSTSQFDPHQPFQWGQWQKPWEDLEKSTKSWETWRIIVDDNYRSVLQRRRLSMSFFSTSFELKHHQFTCKDLKQVIFLLPIDIFSNYKTHSKSPIFDYSLNLFLVNQFYTVSRKQRSYVQAALFSNWDLIEN